MSRKLFPKQIEKAPSDKVRLNSYLRLADCRFVTTKYAAAMDAMIESKV
jgi:hypothetical protein